MSGPRLFRPYPHRFAKLIGVHWRQEIRYTKGETPVPEPLAKLLRTVINHSLTAEQIG
jgi:hypothetical protein